MIECIQIQSHSKTYHVKSLQRLRIARPNHFKHAQVLRGRPCAVPISMHISRMPRNCSNPFPLSYDFAKRGLILFCLRNGILRQPGEVPYAEKIMIVGENQECPWHYHKVKMEDIIVRGGGNLVIELCNLTDDGKMDMVNDVHVRTDGKLNILPAGGKVVLEAGQSVTLPRTLVHRFYGEEGKGPVIVGEVSQVNDDLADNFFFDCDARFSEIENDVAPIHPLWNELAS